MIEKRFMLKWIFYGSLAINLFFIGIFIVGFSENHLVKQLPPERLYGALHVLAENDQAKVRAILDKHTPNIYKNFASMIEQFIGLRKVVNDKKLNYNLAESYVENMHKHHKKVTGSLLNIIKETSETLDNESRILFFTTAIPDSPHFIDKKKLESIISEKAK